MKKTIAVISCLFSLTLFCCLSRQYVPDSKFITEITNGINYFSFETPGGKNHYLIIVVSNELYDFSSNQSFKGSILLATRGKTNSVVFTASDLKRWAWIDSVKVSGGFIIDGTSAEGLPKVQLINHGGYYYGSVALDPLPKSNASLWLSWKKRASFWDLFSKHHP